MKQYKSYKPSGTPWIGDIPSHWENIKLSYICDTITDFVASGSFADLRENVEYLDEPDFAMLVRTADLSQKGNLAPVYVSKQSYNFLSNSNLFGGELVLPNIGSVGDVYMVPSNLYENMTLAPNAIMVKSTFNKYLYYFFSSKCGCEAILNIAQGTTQMKFNKTQLRALKVIIPPHIEHEAIVAYLDKKCESIDKVIATQERRIALLTELKQSIITEAVTLGLNPDAPLKDSGIDWIGQIPEHWEIMRMNFVCSLITDFVASGSFADLRENVEYLDDPDYAMLIRTADLSNKTVNLQKVYISKESYDFLSNSNLFGGEIVLPNIGASIGDVYIVPTNLYPRMSLAPNSIMVNSKCNNLYLYYYFFSKSGRESLNLIGTASAQGKFNKTDLRALKVPVPPEKEQQEIVEFIQKRINPIAKAIIKVKREVELLHEVKQSVITEAVTGKIKVC